MYQFASFDINTQFSQNPSGSRINIGKLVLTKSQYSPYMRSTLQVSKRPQTINWNFIELKSSVYKFIKMANL